MIGTFITSVGEAPAGGPVPPPPPLARADTGASADSTLSLDQERIQWLPVPARDTPGYPGTGIGGNGLANIGNIDFKTHFDLPTDNSTGEYIATEGHYRVPSLYP